MLGLVCLSIGVATLLISGFLFMILEELRAIRKRMR